MANLTLIEKRKLEDLFGMRGGYVLDFRDASFASFFHDMNVTIDHNKYTVGKPSSSKANRLRGFWELENDNVVGMALEKLIEYAEYLERERERESGVCLTKNKKNLIDACRNIANELTGNRKQTDRSERSERGFLAIEFGEITFSKLPIEGLLHSILESRLDEARICLDNNANLAVIFMAGSILEGVVVGAALRYPREFNESRSCPKDDKGKPKPFHKWTLSQLINAGGEINLLGDDVKQFSHALRDFRNYIHPYEQMCTHFNPDKDTAKICLQVLKAALSDLSKNTPK